jgi:hypothetical protein
VSAHESPKKNERQKVFILDTKSRQCRVERMTQLETWNELLNTTRASLVAYREPTQGMSDTFRHISGH